MGIAAEKPTVRERIAAAVSDGDGWGLEQAAVLGSAQLPRGDDGLVLTLHDQGELSVKERVQLATRDGKDLGLELAALLLRAKYAGDHSGIGLANFRFALRLRVRSKSYLGRRGKAHTIVAALASQSIAEWLADRCEPCKGSGLRGASMGGMEETMRACTTCRDHRGEPTGQIVYKARGVRPDGTAAPKATAFRNSSDPYIARLYASMVKIGMDEITIQCPDCRGQRYRLERKRVGQKFGRLCARCGGDGEALPRHAERARALGVSGDVYRKNWREWFVWAGEHLSALDKTLISALRCAIGEGYSSLP